MSCKNHFVWFSEHVMYMLMMRDGTTRSCQSQNPLEKMSSRKESYSKSCVSTGIFDFQKDTLIKN